MKGFEEIAVIHGINDYDEARFLEGFLKWIGVSFFDYVYNDLYDEFNQYLENSGERFDAVIYINDEGDKYILRFGCLSETNIRLKYPALCYIFAAKAPMLASGMKAAFLYNT